MTFGRPLAVVREGELETETDAFGMGGEHAIAALKALAQPARMEIFRMVHAAVDGVPARLIAHRVGGPNSVVSMHLAVLARARMLIGQRQGQHVVYRSNRSAVKALLRYMSSGNAPV